MIRGSGMWTQAWATCIDKAYLLKDLKELHAMLRSEASPPCCTALFVVPSFSPELCKSIRSEQSRSGV